MITGIRTHHPERRDRRIGPDGWRPLLVLRERRMTATWRALARTVLGRPGGVRQPVAFLLTICIVASVLAPAFATLNNLAALMTSSSFLMVAAVGEAFVIMVGMIDLGLESVLAASGMFVDWLTVLHGVPATLAVSVTLIAGAGIGVLVGLLVARVGIPSFIVTLATYWGVRGVALLFNRGNYISPDAVEPPRPFGFSGIAGTIGGIPVLILIAFGLDKTDVEADRSGSVLVGA